MAAVRLARAPGAHRFLALMIYLLVCILANDDRLLIRPQELWVYFWLPLAFIMAGEAREARQAGPSELLREDPLKAYSTSRTNTET